MAPNYPDNVNVIKITNSDGLEYWAYPLEPTQLNQEKPSSSISPPGQGPRDNIRMALQGMNLTIPLGFVLWDDGEDKANGTHSEPVVTVGEQIEYLLDHFHDPNFGIGYTIEQDNGYIEKRLPSYEAQLENIIIPIFDPGSSKWLEGCELRFEPGDVL